MLLALMGGIGFFAGVMVNRRQKRGLEGMPPRSGHPQRRAGRTLFGKRHKYAGLQDFSFSILVSENREGKSSWLKGASHMYEMEFVRGHVEVYLDGAFCFSADTRGEAEAEIAEMSA